MEYSYTALFEPAEEGGYVAFCPALPGLVAEGDTYEEAREQGLYSPHEGLALLLETSGQTCPPSYATFGLKRRTLISIVEQAGFSIEEFLELL